MNWVRAVAALRERREAGVLVTLASVRGHAPREAGAKLVVGAAGVWGTIGGGNLEHTAIERARELLASPGSGPQSLTITLSDKADSRHGVQCCGGEVSVLLEELPVPPAVAIIGLGHVGMELARILSRRDLDLHLVDSRADQVAPARLAVVTADAVARVVVHHAVVPELVLGELPAGTEVLLMTHDHAEDAALCDAALRCAHLGSIGLIGSAAKWRRFTRTLSAEGHDEDALARIVTPIGTPQLRGKDPATVALSVAAELVRRFESARTAAARTPG